MRIRVLWALAVLSLAYGQRADLSFDYPDYLYVELDAPQVVYDLGADQAPAPGWLARYRGRKKPYDRILAADQAGWQQCLGIQTPPAGSYRGTPASPGAQPRSTCYFAPTRVAIDKFRARYRDAGKAPCQNQDMKSDADLLVLSNRPWEVAIGYTQRPPKGVKAHVLPLTYLDAGTLCAARVGAVNDPKKYDKTPKNPPNTRRLAGSADHKKQKLRLAFYTGHAGVQVLPMLYYLEVDLSRVGDLTNRSITFGVRYLVRAK